MKDLEKFQSELNKTVKKIISLENAFEKKEVGLALQYFFSKKYILEKEEL